MRSPKNLPDIIFRNTHGIASHDWKVFWLVDNCQSANTKMNLFYLAFMHSAWVSEHIMKPIFTPIFKNFGIILK